MRDGVVAVEAGERVTFDLEIVAGSPQSVALDVVQQPDGWTTTLRGGGFVAAYLLFLRQEIRA